MDTQTGRGVRRRRQELLDVDDDNDINNKEESVQVTQQEFPNTNSTTESTKPTTPPLPPQQTHYKRPKLKYYQFKQELEELEIQEDLSPNQQSRLDYLINKLNNWNKNKNNHNQNEYYNLPSLQQSKNELLHQRQQQKQQQQQRQQSFQPSRMNWEDEQFKRADQLILQNDDKIYINDDKEYEFVFDQSQFVNYDEKEEEELPGDEEDEEGDRNNNSASINAKYDEVRKSLPVYSYREEFLKIINENQTLIVVGETGSGKTTQLPQYLYEAGYSQNNRIIACTQPRRVAATSVAKRVADEMQVKLGEQVGYNIRFDDNCKDGITMIKYVTDGMLLREFLQDPTLEKYSVIMIDEAHERTLSTEILLSLLKDIIMTTTRKNDLKIIIASATINAEKFSKFFNNAPILNIPGRRFPVKIHYTKQPEANYIQAAITTIFQIHMTQPLPGDILVFLTGQDEIETMEEILHDLIVKLGDQINPMMVCSIYANLPQELQQKIFQQTPTNTRKIVLATNIAETSITIDGISYVIDPGYVKQNVYNPITGMESLVVVPCSRASADQRAGRAGRVGPGKCFRLFTKWSFYNELDLNQQPEIQRVNLTSVILLLLSLGINDLLGFEFMDPPSKQAIIKALNLLYALGALNSQGKLTKIGKKMSEFPLDPIFTKCILTSDKFDNTKQIISIIAMLNESSNLFYRPKDKKELADKRKQEFNDSQGDQFMLLNIWQQWVDSGYSVQWCQDYFIQYKTMKRIKNIYEQLIRLSRKIGIEVNNHQHPKESNNNDNCTLLTECLISGFFNNIVKLSPMGDCYQKLTNGKNGNNNTPCYIHPSSCLYKLKPKPKYLLYYELVLTSKEYMRNCIILDEKLIKQYL